MGLIKHLKALLIRDPKVKALNDLNRIIDSNQNIELFCYRILYYWKHLNIDFVRDLKPRTLNNLPLNSKSDNILVLQDRLEVINRILKYRTYDELSNYGNRIDYTVEPKSIGGYFSDHNGLTIGTYDGLMIVKMLADEQLRHLDKLENLNRLWPVARVYDDLVELALALLRES